MGIFDVFKRKKCVWRNAVGTIACPGDNCPQKCDERCPIWLNTLGLGVLHAGEYEKAISLFRKALTLAPDFDDAQYHMGNAYEMLDQHREAREAFAKALEINPKYLEAMGGLIVSETRLGRYADALLHCTTYDEMGGDATRLRVKIYSSLKNADSQIQYGQIVTILTYELLNLGVSAGYITKKDYDRFPEITIQAKYVCSQIFDGVVACRDENPDKIAHPAETLLVWSALSGMGAVYHWSKIGNQPIGVFEFLTAERGFCAMDEYVLGSIGLGSDNRESRELVQFLKDLFIHCIERLDEMGFDPSYEAILWAAQAMYNFGASFEYSREALQK